MPGTYDIGRPAAGATGGGSLVRYRFSTSLFGRRFFVAVLAGSEARAMRRLREDGVLRNFWAVAVELSIVCLALSLMICLITGFVVITLYLAKSAMGVDLLSGASVLHPVYELLFGP
jgi:hypothetical protein